MKKIYYNLIILLFSIYILELYRNDKLTYYIHPRFLTFTLVTTTVAIIFSSIGIIFNLKRYKNGKFKFADLKISVILLPVLLVAFILPTKTLSSEIFQRRIDSKNTLTSDEGLTTLQRFNSNTKSFDLGDWVIALNSDPDTSGYENKEVDIDGFIFKEDAQKDGYFTLAKFAITCCAVDARPLGLEVKYDLGDDFREDEWINIEGKFQLEEERLIIIPEKIEKIETPKDPYIY